jgi:hypothetical protein
MIKNILKTLSDVEIMSVAEQLANEEVNEQMVYRQIVSKSNCNDTLEKMYSEMNSDNFRGTLPRFVALELSNRLRYKNTSNNYWKSRSRQDL